MTPYQKNSLVRRIFSAADGVEMSILGLLIQKANEDLKLCVAAFPVELPGGRKVAFDGELVDALVERGFANRTDGGLTLLVDQIMQLLKKEGCMATNTTTSTTSIGSRIKKPSTTFVFEKFCEYDRPLAFVTQIGSRVRAGMLAQVAPLQFEDAQMVVHEVGARVLNGSITGDAVTYCRGIVAKALKGRFVPAAGLQLADDLDALDDMSNDAQKKLLRAVK